MSHIQVADYLETYKSYDYNCTQITLMVNISAKLGENMKKKLTGGFRLENP